MLVPFLIFQVEFIWQFYMEVLPSTLHTVFDLSTKGLGRMHFISNAEHDRFVIIPIATGGKRKQQSSGGK